MNIYICVCINKIILIYHIHHNNYGCAFIYDDDDKQEGKTLKNNAEFMIVLDVFMRSIFFLTISISFSSGREVRAIRRRARVKSLSTLRSII
jgi:hypothetical protein